MSDEPEVASPGCSLLGVVGALGLVLMFVYPPAGAVLCAIALIVVAVAH